MKKKFAKKAVAVLSAGLLSGLFAISAFADDPATTKLEQVEFILSDEDEGGYSFGVGTKLADIQPEMDTTGVDVIKDGNLIATNKPGYVRYYKRGIGKHENAYTEITASDGSVKDTDVIEAGYDYQIEFTYRAENGYSLPSPYKNEDCIRNGTPVASIAFVDGQTRTVRCDLYANNQGTGSFNLTSGNLTLSPKDNDPVEKATARLKATAFHNVLVAAMKKEAIKLTSKDGAEYADLDKDNNDDLKYYVNDKGAYVYEVLESNSVSSSWNYTVSGIANGAGNPCYNTLSLTLPVVEKVVPEISQIAVTFAEPKAGDTATAPSISSTVGTVTWEKYSDPTVQGGLTAFTGKFEAGHVYVANFTLEFDGELAEKYDFKVNGKPVYGLIEAGDNSLTKFIGSSTDGTTKLNVTYQFTLPQADGGSSGGNGGGSSQGGGSASSGGDQKPGDSATNPGSGNDGGDDAAAEDEITVKAAKTSVKKAKKAQKIKLTVKAPKGSKIKYDVKSTAKKLRKYVSVSNKGVVTLKKKAPKGTYKIKVTIQPKGSKKKTTKTIKIKVK